MGFRWEKTVDNRYIALEKDNIHFKHVTILKNSRIQKK